MPKLNVNNKEKIIKNKVDLEGDVLVNKKDLADVSKINKKHKFLNIFFPVLGCIGLAGGITATAIVLTRPKTEDITKVEHDIEITQPTESGWNLSALNESQQPVTKAKKGDKVIFAVIETDENVNKKIPNKIEVKNSTGAILGEYKLIKQATNRDYDVYYTQVAIAFVENMKVEVVFEEPTIPEEEKAHDIKLTDYTSSGWKLECNKVSAKKNDKIKFTVSKTTSNTSINLPKSIKLNSEVYSLTKNGEIYTTDEITVNFTSTMYASIEWESVVEKVNVKFFDGVSEITSLTQEIEKGTYVGKPTYSKTGYIFKGWKDKNDNYFDFTKVVNEDTNLYADLDAIVYTLNITKTPKNTYTVGDKFDSTGIEVKLNGTDGSIVDVTSSVKFYSDEDCSTELTSGTTELKDKNLTKIWVKYNSYKTSYTITVNEEVIKYSVILNCGTGAFESSTSPIIVNNIEKDTILSDISGYKVPTKDGCTFNGWRKTDDSKIKKSDVSSTKITDTLNLTACFTPNISEVKSFANTSWADISKAVNAYETKEIDEQEFCKLFSEVTVDYWDTTANTWKTKTYNHTTTDETLKLNSVSKFVGATHSLQLTHQTDVSQTVRILDVNHDTITNTDNKALFTFEFKDLLSDANGYSLACLWNDTATADKSSFNHITSSIRNNLEGEGGKWFEKQGTTVSTTYKTTVLNMLPDDVKNNIKTVVKKVVTKSETESAWADDDKTKPATEYNTKVFLPTMVEVGWDQAAEKGGQTKYWNSNEGTIYKLWENMSSSSTSYKQLIHQQIKGSDGAATSGTSITSGTKYGSGINYAGYNNSTSGDGSFYWLSSPYVNSNSSYMAYRVYNSGDRYWGSVFNMAYPISPNFCI